MLRETKINNYLYSRKHGIKLKDNNMGRPKKTLKAKEPIRIRERKLANGSRSLYLDMYSRGVRKVESLGLYIVPEKTSFDKVQNEHAWQVAQKIKSERILALQTYGINQWEKIQQSFVPLTRFLEEYEQEQNGLSASTVRGRKYMRLRIEQYLRETGRLQMTVMEVDVEFCRDFIKFLRTTKNKRLKNRERNISNCSGLQIQTVFTGALNKALRDGIIDKNPMKQLSSKERFHQQESTREYLTIEELKSMIDTPCEDAALKNAFLFSCFTGLRISDVRSLTWNKVLTFPNGSGLYLRVKMQKTQNYVNTPLSKDALKYMRQTDNPNEPIFKISPATSVITQKLQVWANDANVDKRVSYHVSRHTFATMLLTVGIDIYTVSKLLGHANIGTTQIYAKIIDKKKVDAINKVDDFLMP